MAAALSPALTLTSPAPPFAGFEPAATTCWPASEKRRSATPFPGRAPSEAAFLPAFWTSSPRLSGLEDRARPPSGPPCRLKVAAFEGSALMIARDFPPATRTKPLLPWDAFSSTAASAPSLSWSLEPLPPSVSISIFFDPADSWIRALSAPVAFMTMAACPSVPTVMRPSSATVNSATPDAFTTLKGALKLPCCSSSLATRASSAASRLSSAVGPGVPPGCRFCNSSTAFFRLATWSSSCLILSCELLATFCEFFVQRCICPVMAMSSINCGANGATGSRTSGSAIFNTITGCEPT